MNFLQGFTAGCLLVGATTAAAQSGIGTIAPDPTVALHVKTNAPTQDPLLLEGLRAGTSETNVVVADAAGKLRYRPISDLTISGEWTFSGTNYIYAQRAQAGGNNVVVTNTGRFGIGTTAPGAALQVALGGDLVTAGGASSVRFGAGNTYLGFDDNEIQAFSGGALGPLHLNAEGADVVIGQNNPTGSLFHATGRARIGILPVGDVDGAAPDDRIVTADALGNLRAVATTSLKAGEWRDSTVAGVPLIYANQAQKAGNRVVVTDAGRLGVGTSTPRAPIDVPTGDLIVTGGNIGVRTATPRTSIDVTSGDVIVTGGRLGIGTAAPRVGVDVVDERLIVERPGTDVSGAIGSRESVRLAGNANGDAVFAMNDKTDFEIKLNSTATGGTDQFMSTANRFATRIAMDGDPSTAAGVGQDGDALQFRVSTVAGSAGSNISWRAPLTIENSGEVGIGTTNPQRQFHVDGQIRFERNHLAIGVINKVPATDPQVVLIAPNGDIQRIPSDQLFDNEGEWVDEPAGNYIYAKRARDEGATDFVVVDDDGNMGFGLTTPIDKLHLRGGGMRIDGQTYGIGFNGENPFAANPLRDGSRIYHENNTVGSFQDALIIEKTDFNHGAVDGGIVFANRQRDDLRTGTMVIRGDGNVGIGNNFYNPIERLHVLGNILTQTGGQGTAATGGLVRTGDPYTNPVTWAVNGLQASDETDGAFFGVRTLSANRADGVILWGDNNEDDFKFYHSNGASTTEVIHLDGATKNVGIGTATPSARLHVGGNVRIDDLPAGDLNKVAPDDEIVTADANGNLRKVPASALFQTFEDDDWVINGTNIYNKNIGNVGIGTTNPTFKLDVNGAMRLGVGNYFQLGASANNRITVQSDDDIAVTANRRFRFQNRTAAADLLVVDGNAGAVGIGTAAPVAGYGLDFATAARFRENVPLLFGNPTNNIRNLIYNVNDNDFRLRAQTLFNVRNRNDDRSVMTVHSVNERVGVLTDNPSVAFHVNGQARVETLPTGATGDDLVSADINGNLRRLPQTVFSGPWDRNTGAGGRTYLRNVTDKVGIGLVAPTSTFHVYEATGTARAANAGSILLEHGDNGGESSIVFKSRSNNNSDYGYISYSDDGSLNGTSSNENSLLEIGVQNDGLGNNQDDIALMPTGRLGINTRGPQRMLHVEGDARITGLPAVTPNSTDLAVTMDPATGDLRTQPITSIKDNLGNHQMTQNLATNGFTLSNTGINAGLRFSATNGGMFSGRMQLGNLVASWIDDPITQLPPGTTSGAVLPGFAGNDGAIFAPVYTGSEDSDLRLYILDNDRDAFSIWGNPCGTANCGNINTSKQVARFRADGRIQLDNLATLGADRMVVADATGFLKTAAIPSASGGTADNLGNHTAVTNIQLRNNWLTNDGTGGDGLRVADDGTILLSRGRVLAWNQDIFGTVIVGDAEANGEGGNSDLKLRADDDVVIEARGGSGGDIELRADNDIELRAEDEMYFRIEGNSNNDRYRFVTRDTEERVTFENNGDVRVHGLGGGGNRIVTVDNNGVLRTMSGSSTGLWDRDIANNETYLTNGADEVGIGTADPLAALHLSQATATGLATAVEHRLQNRTNNGSTAVTFLEGGGTNVGMRLVYDGGDNVLKIQDAAGVDFAGIRRPGGDYGIGTVNPQTQLHVVRNAAVGGAGPGLTNPARLRIQNEVTQGSAAIELMEGTGNINNNNGISLRYHSTADGAENHFEIVRGDASSTAAADVHLRVERNNGQVTLRNLATGGTDQMVVANTNGVLSTRAFDAALWNRAGSSTTLANLGDQVGIGTAAPAATLDVNGSVNVRGLGAGAATDNFVVADPATGRLRFLPASTFTNYWARAGAGELVLATASDRLGIGTTPASGVKLHVGTGTVRLEGLAGTATRIVVADALGTLATQTLDNFESHWRRDGVTGHVRLATASDFVGIGVAAPQARLHVDGKVRFNDLAVAGGNRQVMADANGQLYTQAPAALLWTRDAATQSTYATNGGDKIGIGTSSPATKLHVASGAVTISDLYSATGNQTTDRVVVADASGQLKSLPVGTLSSPWFEDGSARVKLRNNDSWVGIGTQAPTSVLHVEDDIPNAVGAMEVRLQNRAGNGEVNLRFRTGTSSGGFAEPDNSMVLRYTNQYDAMEIMNGYGRLDAQYSSLFKVQRNGRVGINLGTAAPTRQLDVNGDQRLDGNLYFTQSKRIQFADANSFLGDNGNIANDDLYLSAEEDMYLQGRRSVYVRANTAANGDFDVRVRQNVFIEAQNDFDVNVSNDATVDAAGAVRIAAGADDLDLRGNRMVFRRGGTVHGLWDTDGRLEVRDNAATYDLDVLGIGRSRGGLRVDALGGGGGTPQMVVADNNGTLSTQAIPTYDNYWARDGSNNRVTTAVAGDQVVINGIGTGVGALNNLSRFYVNGLTQVSSLAGTGTRMVVAAPNGQLFSQPVPTFTDADDQTLSYNSGTGLLTISKSLASVDLGTEVSIDDQQLTRSGGVLSLTNSPSVDLSNVSEIDDQQLGLSGNVLSLTNSASVTLPANTDNQSLTYNSGTGVLSISGGNAVSLSTLAGPWTRSGTDVALTTASDNVGIGTAAPSARLHVNGTVRFEGLGVGLTTDSLLTVDAAGRVARLNMDQIGKVNGVVSGALTKNLATGTKYLSVDGSNSGIRLYGGGAVALGGTLPTPHLGNVLTVRGGTYVGTSATAGTLIFGGNLTNSGKVQTSSFQMTTGAGVNKVLVSDATGNATWIDYNPIIGVITSDERLKRDITPMTNALDAVALLRSVTYRYTDGPEAARLGLDTATHYGLLAQEVQKVFPHAVTERDGYLQLKERELIGVLFAATGELRAATVSLGERNRRLEAELAELKAAKTDLERDVHSLSAETRELQKNMSVVLRHLDANRRVQATEH